MVSSAPGGCENYAMIARDGAPHDPTSWKDPERHPPACAGSHSGWTTAGQQGRQGLADHPTGSGEIRETPAREFQIDRGAGPGDPIHGKGWQDTCGTGRKVQGLGPDHLSAYEKVNLDSRALLFFLFPVCDNIIFQMI